MPLKKSQGNMYDWVTHVHTHLGGECPHKCSYCYVGRSRFGRPARYTGPLRLIKEELSVDYGQSNTIFIEHMNDLFAEEVQLLWISDILDHCRKHPLNQYVFQTKNPERALAFTERFPENTVIGTTIETNVPGLGDSMAPIISSRFRGIKAFRLAGVRTFITIEPIMDFGDLIFSDLIIDAKPSFINIGADSKRSGLTEPPAWKVEKLIQEITKAGIEIRKKSNLERLGVK